MDSTPNHDEIGRPDEQLSRLEEQLSKLGQNAARPRSGPVGMNRFRPAVSGDRPLLGGWALRGVTGFLLAACVGVAVITWWQSDYRNAAKAAPSQPAPLAQTAPPAAALSSELTQLHQSIARDFAAVGQAIEQLKASQEQMARDNANVAEQLKASQEQTVRVIAQVSEQFKASQEQMARDNANVAEQLKASQEQLARVIAQLSEQKPRPRISALPPGPTATPTRKPVPTLSSPQATAQPKAEKPQLSSASPRPAPAR
jgi:Skp family chaperone for outer membrane proteins